MSACVDVCESVRSRKTQEKMQWVMCISARGHCICINIYKQRRTGHDDHANDDDARRSRRRRVFTTCSTITTNIVSRWCATLACDQHQQFRTKHVCVCVLCAFARARSCVLVLHRRRTSCALHTPCGLSLSSCSSARMK